LNDPPHGFDFGTQNIYLFPALKEQLSGNRFTSNEDVQHILV
jgi:hypothetical protein